MIVGDEGRKERLRAAISRLPLRSGADIDGALNRLQLGTYFATVNELPRMTTSQRKNGDVIELQQFAKLARRLRKHINTMHREALNVLSPPGERHALAVDGDLEEMIRRALERIAGAPDQPATTSPKRLAPEQISQLCAQLYTDLTGKRAVPHGKPYNVENKKGGPYLRFLSDVYAALGIRANAEHYGRNAEGVEVIGGNGGITMTRERRKEG